VRLSSVLASAACLSRRAAVQGLVLDQTGKSIPAAEVTLRQADTGFLRKVTSNADGARDQIHAQILKLLQRK